MVLFTNSVRARLRSVGETETSRKEDILPKVNEEVVNTNTVKDRQVDRQAPKGEVYKTFNGEDKARDNLIGYIHYNGNYSRKVTAQYKAPQREVDGDTLTGHEHVHVTAYNKDFNAQETYQGEVLLPQKSYDGDKSQWNPGGELNTFIRNNITPLTRKGNKSIMNPYEERNKDLKREHGEHQTSKREGNQITYGRSKTAFNKDQRTQLIPTR